MTPEATAPDAPTGGTATAVSTTSIAVAWNVASGATSYELDRAEGSAGTFSQIQSGLTTTGFLDTGLTANTLYRYRARAVNANGTSDNSAEFQATTPAPGAKVATIQQVTSDRTLYSDTLYILQGYVKVANGAALTIEAGTRIVGDSLIYGSSLWILRGAQIHANGTATNPIVFTSQRSAGNRKPGDWGGIIFVGNAPINRTGSPIFTEGPSISAENYADGNDFNDSSGNLTYVRVEFAGYDVSNGGGQELNSVSSYAVGRGTQYDYVQAVAGLDDGFEFFGGGADLRHLISFETGDDHFDWTEGFQGRGQFMLAIGTQLLPPLSGAGGVSGDPRGFEGDGCETSKTGCTYANTPYSMPVWANFTVVGPGTASPTFPTHGDGAIIRRGSAANLVNGIIARWPGTGISIVDAESKARMDEDSLYIRNVVLSDNGSNFEAPATGKYGYVVSDSATAWNVTTPAMTDLFAGTPPDANTTTVTDATLGIELKAGADAVTGGLSNFAGTPLAGRVTNYFGGSMAATAYQGAADPAGGTQWYQGWTVWYRN